VAFLSRGNGGRTAIVLSLLLALAGCQSHGPRSRNRYARISSTFRLGIRSPKTARSLIFIHTLSTRVICRRATFCSLNATLFLRSLADLRLVCRHAGVRLDQWCVFGVGSPESVRAERRVCASAGALMQTTPAESPIPDLSSSHLPDAAAGAPGWDVSLTADDQNVGPGQASNLDWHFPIPTAVRNRLEQNASASPGIERNSPSRAKTRSSSKVVRASSEIRLRPIYQSPPAWFRKDDHDPRSGRGIC
jgi:hypothetical protein